MTTCMWKELRHDEPTENNQQLIVRFCSLIFSWHYFQMQRLLSVKKNSVQTTEVNGETPFLGRLKTELKED